MADFEQLGLSKPLLTAIDALEYEKPTAIQETAIPYLISGSDLIGIAQTGGGKSAAFILPLLEKLTQFEERPKPGMPRALILAPTRELAQQIMVNHNDSAARVLERFQHMNDGFFGGGIYACKWLV